MKEAPTLDELFEEGFPPGVGKRHVLKEGERVVYKGRGATLYSSAIVIFDASPESPEGPVGDFPVAKTG